VRTEGGSTYKPGEKSSFVITPVVQRTYWPTTAIVRLQPRQIRHGPGLGELRVDEFLDLSLIENQVLEIGIEQAFALAAFARSGRSLFLSAWMKNWMIRLGIFSVMNSTLS
jgi:hypothetical protein